MTPFIYTNEFDTQHTLNTVSSRHTFVLMLSTYSDIPKDVAGRRSNVCLVFDGKYQ